MGLQYFIAFAGHDLKFPELNDYLCEDYKIYLLSGPAISRKGRPIKRNTAVCYYAKLRHILRIAYKKGIIPQDLHAIVKPITPKETHRERLTLEEFQHLSQTPADSDLMRRAALFSGLTGLRFSDVSTLKWSELRGRLENMNYNSHRKKQRLLKSCRYQIRLSLLWVIQIPVIRLFFMGQGISRLKTFFTHWLGAAGINKNITFRSFRHTFATLQLELGTDIYTVSKMLGHKAFKNTEIYAKIVDKTKRKAADKIMLKMPEEVVKADAEENESPTAFKFIVHRNEKQLTNRS